MEDGEKRLVEAIEEAEGRDFGAMSDELLSVYYWAFTDTYVYRTQGYETMCRRLRIAEKIKAERDRRDIA